MNIKCTITNQAVADLIEKITIEKLIQRGSTVKWGFVFENGTKNSDVALFHNPKRNQLEWGFFAIGNGSEVDNSARVVSVEEFLQKLIEVQPPIHIILNSSHIAVVSHGSRNVTVGCQNISIDKIKEVVAAWNQLNPN